MANTRPRRWRTRRIEHSEGTCCVRRRRPDSMQRRKNLPIRRRFCRRPYARKQICGEERFLLTSMDVRPPIHFAAAHHERCSFLMILNTCMMIAASFSTAIRTETEAEGVSFRNGFASSPVHLQRSGRGGMFPIVCGQPRWYDPCKEVDFRRERAFVVSTACIAIFRLPRSTHAVLRLKPTRTR